jgi:hypothetical protein
VDLAILVCFTGKTRAAILVYHTRDDRNFDRSMVVGDAGVLARRQGRRVFVVSFTSHLHVAFTAPSCHFSVEVLHLWLASLPWPGHEKHTHLDSHLSHSLVQVIPSPSRLLALCSRGFNLAFKARSRSGRRSKSLPY